MPHLVWSCHTSPGLSWFSDRWDWAVGRVSSDRVSALSMSFDSYRFFFFATSSSSLTLCPENVAQLHPLGACTSKIGFKQPKKTKRGHVPAVLNSFPRRKTAQVDHSDSLRCEYFVTQFKQKDINEAMPKWHCMTNAIFRKHTLVFFSFKIYIFFLVYLYF